MSIKMESVVEVDLEADYRFIVDDKHTKYVHIEAGVYLDSVTMCCERYLLPLLPEFPSGDWNEGTISCDGSGKPFFSHTAKAEFPSVESVWHPNKFDLHALKLQRKWPRAVHRVLSPQLFNFPVIAKYTNYPDEVDKIEAETAAYKILDGTGICPRFMGHLTEDGRVMGFLMERIEGRAALPQDFDICRAALRKLHERGIKHGDVNRQNFVIQDDGQVKLIDFSEVEYNASPEDLAEEICELERKLNEPSETTGVRGLAADGVTWVFSKETFV